MAASTWSKRLRTVGYEIPSSRSTSLMLPLLLRNTSIKLRYSEGSWQNLHGSKRPLITVEQLRHWKLVMFSLPPHTGHGPCILYLAKGSPPLPSSTNL